MSQALIASQSEYFWVTVTDHNTGLTSEIQSSQLTYGRQFYPIRAAQSDFSFTVQFRSREDMAMFQAFLIGLYRKAVANSSDAIVRFYWPEQSIDYAGIIKANSVGERKFEFAPKRSYTMQLVRDSIYTTTGTFSSVGSWQDIYGTPVVPKIENDPGVADILGGNPPVQGGPHGPPLKPI